MKSGKIVDSHGECLPDVINHLARFGFSQYFSSLFKFEQECFNVGLESRPMPKERLLLVV